jgi:hypothetical protein
MEWDDKDLDHIWTTPSADSHNSRRGVWACAVRSFAVRLYLYRSQLYRFK